MQHDKQERLMCGEIASQTVLLAVFGVRRSDRESNRLTDDQIDGQSERRKYRQSTDNLPTAVLNVRYKVSCECMVKYYGRPQDLYKVSTSPKVLHATLRETLPSPKILLIFGSPTKILQ